MEEFEPIVIAFVCYWCTYTAADLAGTSRLSYPKNVRLVRVMCTGMIDPQYILKAFLEGADGVLVSGCHPGDCHYINGNYKARRRIKLLTEILPCFGFEHQRLRRTVNGHGNFGAAAPWQPTTEQPHALGLTSAVSATPTPTFLTGCERSAPECRQ